MDALSRAVEVPHLELPETREPEPNPVTIGLDVGQRVDPTAICVAEREDRQHIEQVRTPYGPGAVMIEERTSTEDHYLIRHLERLPLGLSYPAVARRVRDVAAGIRSRTRGSYPSLYVDATGVGTPLIDVLREVGVEANIIAVYFTHGDRMTQAEGSEIRLGKAYLVSRLQTLLQGGRLHLPKTQEAQQLARELLDYEIHVDQNANDTYGAFKVGSHDDLVTALGLAVCERQGVTWVW